jgi:hypothetical protein
MVGAAVFLVLQTNISMLQTRTRRSPIFNPLIPPGLEQAPKAVMGLNTSHMVKSMPIDNLIMLSKSISVYMDSTLPFIETVFDLSLDQRMTMD